MRTNQVKKALAEGKVQLGTGFGQFRSQDAVRIFAQAGLHWAFIDTEHGGFDLETVQDLCRIAVLVGLCPIVRVAEMQYSLVTRALDSGAQGIIFPRVESPELLEKAVSWTKFPPAGIRGFGLVPLHVDHEKVSIPQIIEHVNANTMVVLQIETQRAVDARDELLSVPGIDAVMIGPADLSISLGIGGEFLHARMVDAIDKIRDSCVKHGVAPGTHTRGIEQAKFLIERGLRFIGCSNDTTMLYDRASEIVRALS
jgi:2-dehydro-3-deoxyglucarate aldolase/4-hydroxy-2-oxoheptanedioate aldolase